MIQIPLFGDPYKNGTFLVKSYSSELAKADFNRLLKPIRGLWKGLVPYRIEILSCMAILGKLNTKSKLARLGIIELPCDMCVFCNEFLETVDRLFLHCPFSGNYGDGG